MSFPTDTKLAATGRLLDAFPDPALLVTATGRIERANALATRLLAPSGGPLPGRRLHEFVCDLDALDRLLLQGQRTSAPLPVSLDLNVSGRDTKFRASIGVVHPGPEPVLYFRLQPQAKAVGHFLMLDQKVSELSREVHERQRAEAALNRLNQSLEQQVKERTQETRSLASALTLAEQTERRRIGQVLHDELQQVLYAIQMKSGLLRRKLVDHGPEQALAEKLVALIERAISTTRTLTIELSPPLLANEGLGEALAWLAQHMHEQYGLPVELEVSRPLPAASEDLRVMLFQFARELLFNVVKHAAATQAWLTAGVEADVLYLEVRDNGCGLSDETLLPSPSDRGFGLFSIRERLALFGGHFELSVREEGGTRAHLTLPIR